MNASIDFAGYETHFGLRESPFAVTPDPRYAFASRPHKAALDHITFGLGREGLTVVSGEAGTGKTMLCRLVAEQCDARVVVAMLTNTPATREAFLRQLLVGFGVIADGGGHAVERLELLDALHQFLESLVPLGLRAVALVDDAHLLTPDVLEEAVLVSDLSAAGLRLLQVELFGAPKLSQMLGWFHMRSTQQRVIRWHDLGPLDPDEVDGYIRHRVRFAAGDESAPDLFSPSATQAVATLSCGVPQVINALCDRALESACARQLPTVEANAVWKAARTLQPRPSMRWRPTGSRRQLALAAAVFAGAIALVGWPGVHAVSTPRQVLPEAVGQQVPATGPSKPAPAPAPQPIPPAATMARPAPEPTPMPASNADNFDVVAGSFRTPGRAAALAAILMQLDLPVFTRTTASGFEQTVVGPYATRRDAVAARNRLVAAGQTDLQIASSVRPAGSDGRRPAAQGRATAAARLQQVAFAGVKKAQ